MSLLDNPRVYDLIQVLAGRQVTARRLRKVLTGTSGQTVLDFGAGTGNLVHSLPKGAIFWALDNDAAKLEQLRRKVPNALPMLRSALDTGLEDGAVDWAACVTVSHHLDDEQLPRVFAEMARVTRLRIVFLDALWTGKRGVQRLIWRYDRGSYPRSEEALMDSLRTHFELEHVERFWMIQNYLLCVGRPL